MEPGTILLLIAFLLVCLVISVICLLIYSGLPSCWQIEIRAGRPKFGALTVAYKYARGPYKNAGQLFTEVNNYTPTLKSIGLYYDDPKEVAPSDLRYAVGAIVEEGEDDVDASVNREYAKLLLQKGYKLTKLPAVSHAVMTEFPFKNTVSIFMAVAKVYPKLSQYIKERNLCAHPMIEVYENDVIHFVAPLAKQDEFYVLEAKEDDSDNESASEISTHEPVLESSGSLSGKTVPSLPSVTPIAVKCTPTAINDTDKESVAASGDQALPSKRSHSEASGSGGSSSSFEELNAEAEK